MPYSGPGQTYCYDKGPRHTVGFEPDTFVNISKEWLERLMATMRGQDYDPGRAYAAVEAKRTLAAYQGATCKVNCAEAVRAYLRRPVDVLG